MLSQARTQLSTERRNSFNFIPSMDFASTFCDKEVRDETRIRTVACCSPNQNKSVSLLARDDTHDHESLLLDDSIHTFGLNYDSVEHQLSLLERDSDDLFDSLLGTTKRKKQKNSSVPVPLQESTAFPITTKSLRRNSITFNFDEDLGFNDIDDLFKSDHTAAVTTTDLSTQSESTNSPVLVSTEKSGPRDNKNKKPTVEDMHAFNQEYESRLNDLRQCMSRTKSSRTRVAKIKQVMMSQRYFKNKYSYRNRLARSLGINTTCTDNSRQKLLQSQMYLNQVSDTSLLSTTSTVEELSRHSSRSNSPNSHAAITLNK